VTFISPVLVFGFNRPVSLMHILEKIPMESGRIVWISLDGPSGLMKRDNTEEVKRVAEKFSAQWDKQVKLIVREENMGLQRHCRTSMREFFENHKAGIVFDDDIVPTNAFFEYMDFMLEKHQNDRRVFAINGWTPFLPKEKIKRAHFTRYFVSWGWATWADRFLKIDFELNSFEPDAWWKSGTTVHLRKNLGFRMFWSRRFNLITSGPKNRSWDWELLSEMWRMNGLCISPPERLVTNVGYDEVASHPNSGSFRQKAEAREPIMMDFLEVEAEYDTKLDLKYERLMWDLGRQRALSSLRYRMDIAKHFVLRKLSLSTS
jgi:hypothetical protein